MAGLYRASLRRRVPWYRSSSIIDPESDDDGGRLLARIDPWTANYPLGSTSGYEPPYSLCSNFELWVNGAISMAPPSSELHADDATYTCASTLSLDPASSPEQSPTDRRFAKYCEPCQKSQASPGFGDRIADLLDPLYCAGCQTQHPSILFSSTSRRTESARRICIGRQGYYTASPHLAFTLADVEAWIKKDEGFKICCPESGCPPISVTVDRVCGMDYIAIQWNTALDDASRSSTFEDRCFARLHAMHRSFPALFCPHLQTTPGTLSYHRTRDHKTMDGKWAWYCATCFTRITCDSSAEDAKQISSCCIMQLPYDDEKKMSTWVRALDPESYGHFSDQDTKHITWCDDRFCITTRELRQFSELISPAMKNLWPPFRDGSGRAIRFLETLVTQSIARGNSILEIL
ncbi:hypothetical protein AUP68_07831 [Ilyonectria robusta]